MGVVEEMGLREDCKYFEDGKCIDGQECKYNGVTIRTAKCFVSKYTHTDCKHYRRKLKPSEQCGALVSGKNGHVQCAVCKLGKDGRRKECTFYDRGK